MSYNSNKGKIVFYCTVVGGIASIVTILAFFGVVRFPFIDGRNTSTPTSNSVEGPTQTIITPAPTTPVQTSTPLQTLTTFCSDLQRGDISTANSQLTPRYLNYIQTQPPSNDPYTGCAFGSLAESSTSEGVIYYYASITFYHQSGAQRYGTVDLIQTSDGNWRIDEINCGSSYC